MNKPYHIVVWDCLNEVFGIKWKIHDNYGSIFSYESLYLPLDMEDVDLDCSLTIGIRVYWESGKIEGSYFHSTFEDKNGDFVEWEWNGKTYLYDITFENIETFKAFLEHNKRRFYNE